MTAVKAVPAPARELELLHRCNLAVYKHTVSPVPGDAPADYKFQTGSPRQPTLDCVFQTRWADCGWPRVPSLACKAARFYCESIIDWMAGGYSIF